MHSGLVKILKLFGVKSSGVTVPVAAGVAAAPRQAVPAPAAVPAPVEPAAVPPPPAAPSPEQVLRQRVDDLERRLGGTEEKAIAGFAELRSLEETQRQAARQAADAAESSRAAQVTAGQVRALEERLAGLEKVCHNLAAGHAEADAAKNKFQALAERLSAVELKLGVLTASRDSAVFLVDRLGSAESRLSAMESRVNEALVRGELRDKMTTRDNTVARERMERMEKNYVPLDYVEKRLAGYETDSSMVRKVEGLLVGACKKIEKLEGATQVLLLEQNQIAGNSKADGAVLEELRGQVASLSVLFNQVRHTAKDGVW